MARSVRVNFILNLINQGTKLLFPIVTFPYVSRVMQPEGVGQVQFCNSIITYISLFTLLGIPLYAIREIARVRNDQRMLTIKALEILLLLGFLMLVGYFIVILIAFFVPQVSTSLFVFLIVSSVLLFNAIGCEWFFQGMEDFLYVTIRGLVVRSLAIVFLFVMVKTQQDIIYYAIYVVLSSVGGNFSNLIRLRRFIKTEGISMKDLHPKSHLKPALKIFAYNVVVSVYVQMNTVLLGFMKVAADVGFFTVGVKVMKMIMQMSNSVTTAIMPRSSSLVAEKKYDEFFALIQKSYEFTFFLALPVSVGLFLLSPYLVTVLSGEGFVNSIPVSQIVSPLIFVVGMSCVFGSQSLYPMGKIGLVTKTSISGALVDLLLSFILVPRYGYIGSAIAYLIAEIVVFAHLLYYAKKFIPIHFWKKSYLQYLYGVALMAISMLMVPLFIEDKCLCMVVMFGLGVISYVGVLSLCKNSFTQLIFSKLRKQG